MFFDLSFDAPREELGQRRIGFVGKVGRWLASVKNQKMLPGLDKAAPGVDLATGLYISQAWAVSAEISVRRIDQDPKIDGGKQQAGQPRKPPGSTIAVPPRIH